MKQGKTATSADIPTVCISRVNEPCHKEAGVSFIGRPLEWGRMG